MTNRENMKLFFEHKKPEWIPHYSSETYGIRDYMVERPINTTGYDAWGCNWISCPDSLNITHPDTTVTMLPDLKAWRETLTFPDIDSLDFSALEEEAKAFTDRESKMVQYTSLNGIFERTHILMGFNSGLCQSFMYPDDYSDLLSAIADHKIRVYKKMYEIAQPDILLYHDDLGTQAAPFYNNEFYVKYIFPHYKRIVAAAKEIGYKYVVHHCCGKVDVLLNDWLECGFDGWDSVNPCNNLSEVKAKYGDKIVLMPGLDTQGVLANKKATRSDIEHMVVEFMETLAPEGTGLMIDSLVAYSLNPTNEAICLEFIQKHGKPFMDAKKAGVPYVPNFE